MVVWPSPPAYYQTYNQIPILKGDLSRTDDPKESNGMIKSCRPESLMELRMEESDVGLLQLINHHTGLSNEQALLNVKPRRVYTYANANPSIWGGHPLLCQALGIATSPSILCFRPPISSFTLSLCYSNGESQILTREERGKDVLDVASATPPGGYHKFSCPIGGCDIAFQMNKDCRDLPVLLLIHLNHYHFWELKTRVEVVLYLRQERWGKAAERVWPLPEFIQHPLMAMPPRDGCDWIEFSWRCGENSKGLDVTTGENNLRIMGMVSIFTTAFQYYNPVPGFKPDDVPSYIIPAQEDLSPLVPLKDVLYLVPWELILCPWELICATCAQVNCDWELDVEEDLLATKLLQHLLNKHPGALKVNPSHFLLLPPSWNLLPTFQQRVENALYHTGRTWPLKDNP